MSIWRESTAQPISDEDNHTSFKCQWWVSRGNWRQGVTHQHDEFWLKGSWRYLSGDLVSCCRCMWRSRFPRLHLRGSTLLKAALARPGFNFHLATWSRMKSGEVWKGAARGGPNPQLAQPGNGTSIRLPCLHPLTEKKMFPEGNYLDAEVILPGDWLLATPGKKDYWSKIGFPKVFGAAQRDSPGVALPYQPPPLLPADAQRSPGIYGWGGKVKPGTSMY